MSPCSTYRPWLGSSLGSRLETALQAAVLRRSALAEAQPQPSAGLLAPVRLPQRRPQRAEGPQPPGPAVLNYFKEKLDECLEDRRRFFERRYLLLRELCLSRACGLPQLRPAVSQPCRGDKPTPEEVLAEWERTWLPSDQALLEARVLRARARHRRFFEEVRAKERCGRRRCCARAKKAVGWTRSGSSCCSGSRAAGRPPAPPRGAGGAHSSSAPAPAPAPAPALDAARAPCQK
ncbi:unnamed protein product [Effrenium voratum]|nr:unnamed protein product [Effrenium voratum]